MSWLGVVPSTNPTSTAIYKLLISIKARCAVVIKPASLRRKVHPLCCGNHECELARRVGFPRRRDRWMYTVTLEGTQELMPTA